MAANVVLSTRFSSSDRDANLLTVSKGSRGEIGYFKRIICILLNFFKFLTCSQVVECDHSGREFTVEIVVSLIDSSQTGVCVVIGIHAKTKRLVIPQRSRFPVRRVVAEAIHLLRQTLLFHAGLLITFTFFLTLPF